MEEGVEKDWRMVEEVKMPDEAKKVADPTEGLAKWECLLIPMDRLETDPDNPNVMTDVKFNALVEQIEEEGFDEPLQVVLHPEIEKAESGLFLIVGGEHRFRAAKILGIDSVPAVLKEFDDEVERKSKMVRRNIVHGDLDKVRFSRLFTKMKEMFSASPEELRKAMGFGDMQELEKNLIKERKKRDEDLQDAMDDARKEMMIVDNVSFALNEIFSKHGDTVPHGYMLFAHKNRMHLIVQCERRLYDVMQVMANSLARESAPINTFLADALEKGMEEDGWETLLSKVGEGDYEPTDPEEVEGQVPPVGVDDDDEEEEGDGEHKDAS